MNPVILNAISVCIIAPFFIASVGQHDYKGAIIPGVLLTVAVAMLIWGIRMKRRGEL